MSCLTCELISDLSHISVYVEEGEQEVCVYACEKRKGRRRGYELRKEGKSGEEERRREEEGGGGRRERGQSMGDGEIGIEKCIRVRVFSVCLCARVCAYRCVNVCACMYGKYM